MTVQPVSGDVAGGADAGTMAQPNSTGLANVIDTILDKGLVIDAFVRVSLVGIELLTIDARIVVASVETYLRFAEATNRLGLSDREPAGLPDLVGDMTESGAKGKTKGALEAAAEKVQNFADDVQDQRATTHRKSKRGEDR